MQAKLSIKIGITLIVAGMVLRNCTTSDKWLPEEDKRIADESNTSDWLAYGRTHSEQRFSPLTQINEANVAQLKPDWYLDLPDDHGLVSTPLVVKGILYFTGTNNIVRAVDATNGTSIWKFDPDVAKHLGKQRKGGWNHNRGITYYNEKIFTATWDGRLIAIDAKTGKQIWSTLTIDSGKVMNITGAPKAFKGKVIIGNGGSETAPSRGYVTAYDAETGRQAWRFYIVSGNPADGFENDAMRMAATTWTGEWWKHGGGGNAWHGLTYDPDLDLLYVGTGNGGPWNRSVRSPDGGDNLFLCSIIALDPDTGEYRWHYQTTPGESWDYNSCMDIVLADITIRGKKIKAILHAPKNGFFYVINRETGKLISAKPFVETTWASAIDETTGRPIEIPGARYDSGSAYITPSPHGAHSWHAMSYNPLTGLAYIPTIHDAVIYTAEGIDLSSWKKDPSKAGIAVKLRDADSLPRNYAGSLQAWDPVNQKLVWSVPQTELWNAGTLTTAGNLVFQGRADGKFIAYNAATGKALWSFDAGLGISAPPVTYSINERQYVAVLVGWGGAFAGVGNKNLGWDYGKHMRRLIVFSLEGKQEVPAQPPPYFARALEYPQFRLDNLLAEKGGSVYGKNCFVCHGANAIAMGMAPDLRASVVPLDLTAFTDIVKNGSRVNKSMPVFPDLSNAELISLMHYIRRMARTSISRDTLQHSF